VPSDLELRIGWRLTNFKALGTQELERNRFIV
jgi:hypothetical protein